MRIGCISDVCLGYGSPQIGQLVKSLVDCYHGENLVIEPNIQGLAPRHNRFPALHIQRAQNLSSPYGESGRIEYLVEAARILDQWRPDLLVACCTFTIPVLFKLKKRPRFVLYYSYESIPHYGSFDVEANGHLEGMVDAVVFPEENRAALELGRFDFGDIPKLVLYNCPPRHDRPVLPKASRNGRFLYAGTIHRRETLAEYFTLPKAQVYPIDLYGPVRGDSEEDRSALLDGFRGEVQYRGYLDSVALEKLRRMYIYSLVMWNPGSENQLYAAPNKFFESLADGVPPIAAPHPQCKKLIERYRCGVVLDDWSEASLIAGLERGLRLHRTAEWENMVSQCQAAFHGELNWERQFEKLKCHLPMPS